MLRATFTCSLAIVVSPVVHLQAQQVSRREVLLAERDGGACIHRLLDVLARRVDVVVYRHPLVRRQFGSFDVTAEDFAHNIGVEEVRIAVLP